VIKYFATFLFIFSSSLFAQESFNRNFYLDGGIAIGNPSGEFRKNVPNLSGGLGFDILFHPTENILGYGAHIGFLQYGSVSDSRPWSNSIPDVTLDVERSNTMAHVQFLTRVMPFKKSFSPYLDLFAGFTSMTTTTEVRSRMHVENNNDNKIASTENSSDWAFSYGGGVGFKFLLMNLEGESIDYMTGNITPTSNPLYFDFNYKYYLSREAKYLRPEDVVVDTQTGKVTMDFQKSRTDMSVFQIGVSMNF